MRFEKSKIFNFRVMGFLWSQWQFFVSTRKKTGRNKYFKHRLDILETIERECESVSMCIYQRKSAFKRHNFEHIWALSERVAFRYKAD